MQIRKQRLALASAAAALVGLAVPTFGAVTLISDNFDSYTPGQNLSGQGGWTATAAAATPIQVQGTSNLYAAVGSSGQDEYKAFTSASVGGQAVLLHDDGGSVTTTFTLTATAANANGDYFLHLSGPAGTTSNFYERIFAKSSGTGYVLGVAGAAPTTGFPTYGTTVLDFNTAESVSVTWNFVAGALNDTFDIAVNGSSYVAGALWGSTAAEPAASIGAVNLRQGTAANAPTVQVDNLAVVGNATVVAAPEPTTFGLAGVAVAGLLARRRRRLA